MRSNCEIKNQVTLSKEFFQGNCFSVTLIKEFEGKDILKDLGLDEEDEDEDCEKILK